MESVSPISTENQDICHHVNVDESNQRKGTLTSARFNILSTMVGGGSLSLPLAFYQVGNIFTAPLVLIAIALVVQYSIHFLVNASIMVSPPNHHKGTATFEGVAEAAFGVKAKYFCRILLSVICFFTIVGYAILLRDIIEPLSDFMFTSEDLKPRLRHNLTMMIFILIITPLCALKDLTPLQNVGKLSMGSLSVLACIIAYRSFKCNFHDDYNDRRKSSPWDYATLDPFDFASSNNKWLTLWNNVTSSLPILLSVFMCHFNVLPVVNELQRPMENDRLTRLFSSCTWGACVFYIFVGIAGSMYGNCVENGVVEGNILLSFDSNDALLGVGRACLSLTIMCAFPILVVPFRDIILRALEEAEVMNEDMIADVTDMEGSFHTSQSFSEDNTLTEPLIASTETSLPHQKCITHQDRLRVFLSLLIFWTGAILACFVNNIDVVWDILGGSFSLIMGFIIPSGSFLFLKMKQQASLSVNIQESNDIQSSADNRDITRLFMHWSRDTCTAVAIIVLIVPIMVLLTSKMILDL